MSNQPRAPPIPPPLPPPPPSTPATTNPPPTSTTILPPPSSATPSTPPSSAPPIVSTTPSTTSTSSSSSSTTTPPAITITTPNAPTSTSGGGGGVITITSIIATTPIPTLAPSATGVASSAPKTFFHNTAAVASVFSIAGLIAVAIFFVCITNSIRRRRAKKFDRDVAEAAAAAAAAQPPVFDDDIYGTGITGYSDGSHGTYGQPPMNTESYGMSEMRPYDAFTANSGAAGVGVGAAVQRARSRKEISENVPGMAMYDTSAMAPGFGEHSSPYPAFAGPGSQRLYDAPQGGRYAGAGNPAVDLLEAAGISGAAAHVARGPSLHTQQTGYSNLSRNKSQGTYSLYGPGASTQEQVPSESYAAHYQPGYQPQGNGGEMDEEDAYGGYVSLPAPPQQSSLPNPHSPNVVPPHPQEGSGSDYSDGENGDGKDEKEYGRYDESRASFRDEEDYELERGKRVLKVANE